MDFQKLFDAISHASAETRSDYHLTLGGLIAFLSDKPDDMPVQFDDGSAPGVPDSYRGYYSDLAFAPSNEDVTVATLRQRASEAIGETFEGYKGGDFIMSERTPLWKAGYGDGGPAIIGAVVADGKAMLVTKEID